MWRVLYGFSSVKQRMDSWIFERKSTMTNHPRNVTKLKKRLKPVKPRDRKMKIRTHAVRNTNFESVGDFMEAFGQKVEVEPTWPDFNTRELRLELISEEFDELCQAVEDRDMVEIADALTDLLYVIYGAGHAFGLDLDECFTEVHDSNMSKLGEDGRPIHREDGKVLKGPDYFEPNLHEIIYPE